MGKSETVPRVPSSEQLSPASTEALRSIGHVSTAYDVCAGTGNFTLPAASPDRGPSALTSPPASWRSRANAGFLAPDSKHRFHGDAPSVVRMRLETHNTCVSASRILSVRPSNHLHEMIPWSHQ